ncbi:MAG: hypothetical protein ACLSA6_14790 [Holdemania massiliensis]
MARPDISSMAVKPAMDATFTFVEGRLRYVWPHAVNSYVQNIDQVADDLSFLPG